MDSRNKKMATVFALAAGIALSGSALYTYRGNYQFAYELTFLASFAAGVFLIAAGIGICLGKAAPPFLFLDFSVLLLIVLGVTVLFSGQFKMAGMMFVLHVVNPLLMLVCSLILTDQRAAKWRTALTVLAMPVAYLIFALIFGEVTGNYYYFFLNYPEYGIGYMLRFIAVCLAGIVAAGFLLFGLNRLLHRSFAANRQKQS